VGRPASIAADGCLWDPAQQYRDLIPEEKYVNVFGRASFAFGEGGEIYTEIGYSKKETIFSNTPSGVSGGWGYPGGPSTPAAATVPPCSARTILTTRPRARPAACATRLGCRPARDRQHQ
jgi:hypothetical protein